MKKMISLILALVLVLGMLPASVSATEVLAYGYGWNVEWVLTADGTLTIYGAQMNDGKPDFVPPWNDFAELICKVVLTEGNHRVESFAFTELPNLEEVYLPETLESIGASAFGGCPKLKTVYIPAAVDYIARAAFAGCASMTHITVANDNPYFSAVDGALTNKEQTELIQVPGGASGSYTIPASIAVILPGAFMDCHKLTEVVFPDHFDTIPSDILRGLNGLTSVKLPAALTTIPQAAFYESTALASIEIPNGVTAIGFDAFYGCASLKSVVIPASVESLDTQAFADCVSLTDVVFRGHAPVIESESGVFYGDTLTAWYPTGDESWTDGIMQDYYGNVTWKSWEVLPFVDVLPFQFFYDGVTWAVKENITSGTTATTFNPDGQCQRAQVVTFLWRSAGCPAPTSNENPFEDVTASDFYYDAVLWAVEKGITAGVDATHFAPMQSCSRAQVVAFLYRAMGSPKVSAESSPFTDVVAGEWYELPVLWAVENGITAGLSADTFGVNTVCNRAQVVTFLYRTYVN